MPKSCPRCRRKLPAAAFLDGDGNPRVQCGDCRAKERRRFKAHYQANTAKVVQRIAKARSRDPAVHRAAKAAENRRWRKKYPAKKAAANRSYRRRNKGKVAALSLKRVERTAERTPPWADLKKIEAVYVRAARLRAEGHDVHVHHRYPLAGRTVSGLHVHTNLRIVSKTFNLTQSNSHNDDD